MSVRILLLEDVPADAALIQRELTKAILYQGVLQQGVAFLQKPFSLRMLARKVREVIEARP